MADDIKIDIEVDSHEVVRAEKHFKSLNRQYAVLDKAAKSGRISSQQHTKAVFNLNTQLNGLEKSMKRGGDALRQYNTRLNMAKNRTNRFGMVSQQVGYQVGDFFVQVQSGTSALVAFGQQGTQLAGLLPGISGAIIGIGLAIGTMALRTLQQMKAAETGLMSYKEALKKVKEEVNELNRDLKMLGLNLKTEQELVIVQKIEAIQKRITELQSKKVGRAGGQKVREQQLQALRDEIKDYEKQLQDLLKLRFKVEKTVAEIKGAKDSTTPSYLTGISFDAQKASEISFDRGSEEELKRKLKLLSMYQQEVLSGLSKEKEVSEKLTKSEVERKLKLLSMYQQEVLSGLSKQRQEELKLTKELSKQYDDRILRQQGLIQGEYKTDLDRAKLLKETTEQFNLQNKEAGDRIKLLEIELDYGQDSLELETAILQQERWRKIEAARKAKLSEGMIHDLDMQWTREMNLLLLARKQREEKEKLLELEQERLDFEKKIEGFLESGFMSMIDGTKSVTDAFRSMARDVIKELYRILVVQQIVNQAKTAIQSLSGFVYNANGNAFNNGKIIPYANGGVVGSPTMFPMSGGNTGLMGEAGPEAILPLKRGPNGKLGVESSGGSVVVNQTINVSTGVAQTVRNEIKTLMPQIAEGAKSAVLDAKRRGGSFGSAFA